MKDAIKFDKKRRKREAEIYDIILHDVVRSTQAITLLSHLFRKNVDRPLCKNKEFGRLVEPFLISNFDNNTITQYIMRTIDALAHIKDTFKTKKDIGSLKDLFN